MKGRVKTREIRCDRKERPFVVSMFSFSQSDVCINRSCWSTFLCISIFVTTYVTMYNVRDTLEMFYVFVSFFVPMAMSINLI